MLGCILCEHYITRGLRSVSSFEDSMEALCKHIDRISELTGSYDAIGIGSDLDGYIKPALPGLEHMRRRPRLQAHLQQCATAHTDAEKICTATRSACCGPSGATTGRVLHHQGNATLNYRSVLARELTVEDAEIYRRPGPSQAVPARARQLAKGPKSVEQRRAARVQRCAPLILLVLDR